MLSQSRYILNVWCQSVVLLNRQRLLAQRSQLKDAEDLEKDATHVLV